MYGCHDAPTTPWSAVWVDFHNHREEISCLHYDSWRPCNSDYDGISLHVLEHAEPCALQALIFKLVDIEGNSLMPCHCWGIQEP